MDNLCPHKDAAGWFCDQPTHPDYIYCGQHGGADADQPRTINHGRF